MANTYTQLNVHLIFAVKGRENILSSSLRTNLFKYISGILKESDQFPLAVNGYLDHVHVFFELNAKNSVSEIARIIKSNSSKWINTNNYIKGKFHWQEGYGAFSYSRSQRNDVIKYIVNQETHHSRKTFKDEYMDLLKVFEIRFDERYVFEWVDD
ncbi:MAG: IS200/IS605 family transposase [Bacteroidetes bacterium]|nr:IS200/IS605 family transposase [Bacteroidota bacterium]